MTTDRSMRRYDDHGDDKLDGWEQDYAQFEAAAEADAIVAQEYERAIAQADLEWEFGR